MRKLALSLLLSAISSAAFAQDVLIQDATVLTPNGLQQDTDVLMKDGRIVRVGSDIDAPSGADIIAADGHWVTPVLFAPMSSLGLVEVVSEDVSSDNRAGDAKTSISHIIADSFNPKSAHIANVRRRGVGYAVVSPTAAGDTIFGGTGMVAVMDGTFNGAHNPNAFIRVDLGENGTRRAGGSRSAALAQLRAALNDAAAYPSRYDGPEDGDALSRQDAAALFAAARGQVPLLISAHRASDLLALAKLKADYPSLDMIIVGAAESWKVADALKAANIRVIIDPLDNLPTQMEKIGSRLDAVNILDEAGVDYAIANLTSLGVANASLLNQHAGNAVGGGLDWEKAFAAISSTPASWFNVDTGKIESGASASLLVWDGDPLDVTSAPTQMWLSGAPQSLESRQTKLRDRYNPTNDDPRPHKYR